MSQALTGLGQACIDNASPTASAAAIVTKDFMRSCLLQQVLYRWAGFFDCLGAPFCIRAMPRNRAATCGPTRRHHTNAGAWTGNIELVIELYRCLIPMTDLRQLRVFVQAD